MKIEFTDAELTVLLAELAKVSYELSTKNDPESNKRIESVNRLFDKLAHCVLEREIKNVE
jgi:hypothetical protein